MKIYEKSMRRESDHGFLFYYLILLAIIHRICMFITADVNLASLQKEIEIFNTPTMCTIFNVVDKNFFFFFFLVFWAFQPIKYLHHKNLWDHSDKKITFHRYDDNRLQCRNKLDIRLEIIYIYIYICFRRAKIIFGFQNISVLFNTCKISLRYTTHIKYWGQLFQWTECKQKGNPLIHRIDVSFNFFYTKFNSKIFNWFKIYQRHFACLIHSLIHIKWL